MEEKELSEKQRRWDTCPFCGRQVEVRPHRPFDTKEFLAMTIYPMRLCFDCAELQHYIRQIRKYPDTEE